MRRRKGTGSIEPQRDGTFRPRLPSGERLWKFATHAAAAAQLDAALVALVALPSAGLTLASFGETWLDERELAGIRGIQTDRSRWRIHVAASTLAAMPLRSITRPDVRAWLDRLLVAKAKPGQGHASTRDRRLSRSTVKSALNLLRVALETAVQRELLAENPARDVRLPRSSGVTHEPWTYLLPDEQAALLRADDEETRLLAAFALGTGMREGEMWNLELVDVDERRVVVRYGSRGAATKSGKIRRVPLFGLAADALRTWLPLLAERPNPHGLVFPLPSGERRQKGKAPKAWRALAEAALGPAAGAPRRPRGPLARPPALLRVEPRRGLVGAPLDARRGPGAPRALVDHRDGAVRAPRRQRARRRLAGHARSHDRPTALRLRTRPSSRNCRCAPGRNRTCDLRFRKAPRSGAGAGG
jgi:integrase